MMEELRRMTDVTFGSRPNKTEFCPASDPKTNFSGHQHFCRATNTRIGFPWNFVANISNCYNFRLESDKSCLLKQLFGLLNVSKVSLMKRFTPFIRDIQMQIRPKSPTNNAVVLPPFNWDNSSSKI